MVHPFIAAHYAEKFKNEISSLAVPDLDTAEHLWGHKDSSFAFRNVLVGAPEARGELWHAWISSGNISLREEPCYFALHQEQEIQGIKISRWAIYGAVSVHEPNLYIHEDVIAEGVERARQGTEACESDMAPIFVGCEETMGKKFKLILEPYCCRRDPLFEFKEESNSIHRIWPIEDPSMMVRIRSLLENTPLFLLDGHHRLAAARENDRLGMGDGMILVCLSTLDANDTLILPIHRTVFNEQWILPESIHADLIRSGCTLQEVSSEWSSISELLAKLKSEEPTCLMLHSHSSNPYIVTMPAVDKISKTLNHLTVARLDFGFLAQFREARAIPITSIDIALEQLAMDQAQAAFFLAGATPQQVRGVAMAKEKMPRKSTRFVPKPALGLLARPWTRSG